MVFIAERSISRLPSTTALPAMLWLPPRTATTRSFARANSMHRTTSAAPAQRAIRAGRRPIQPFPTLAAACYLLRSAPPAGGTVSLVAAPQYPAPQAAAEVVDHRFAEQGFGARHRCSS